MAKIIFGLLAALCSLTINIAGATTLFGTIGYGSTSWAPWYGYCPTESTCYSTSYLVELNPETGAVIDYIGEVGYYVNGLAYDPTSGKLYAGTSVNDPKFVGLIEIDTTTGAGTPVGVWSSSDPITSITINSSGQMYGWTSWRGTSDLVSIDKATGVATRVGESSLNNGTYGLSFNSIDDLYLVDWGGDTYLVDTTSGSVALYGYVSRDDTHHGSFDWITDHYYALTWMIDGTARDLYRCDLIIMSCTFVGSVGNLHTLAFQNTPGTTKYTLSVALAGTGNGAVVSAPAGINCGTDCSQDYFSGRGVTLYAIADEGSTFAGWSGDADCSDGVVTMDSARSCTATFNLIPTYTLSVSKAGTGTGYVSSDPVGIACGPDCSKSYFEGTSVTLYPVAATSSVFAGWTGDADCSDGVVTMDSAKSCIATFNPKPFYALLVSKAGTGTGTVTSTPAGISCGSDCSESYMDGTSVTLSAVADASSVFAGWSGNADCSDATVTMTSEKACTATFNGRIAVTSPNGGETLQVGTEQTIAWTYVGDAGTYVSIDLLKGGVLDRKIASRVSIGTGGVGSMTWTPRGKLSGSDYSIRVTSKTNETYTDTSDANFTINARR